MESQLLVLHLSQLLLAVPEFSEFRLTLDKVLHPFLSELLEGINYILGSSLRSILL